MSSSYNSLNLTSYETTSEINRKGINFIASPWNYFKVTATRTHIGGEAKISGTLNVVGGAYSTDGWLTLSDSRIKDIKAPFTSSLKELLNLDPVIFSYTKEELGDKEHVGLIANDVEHVEPYLVNEEKTTFADGETINDLRVLNPAPLVYMCINSIKELNTEIETLKQRIDELENGKSS